MHTEKMINYRPSKQAVQKIAIWECVWMIGGVFGRENELVKTHGSVLEADTFLHSLSQCKTKPARLANNNTDHKLIIPVRAVKREKAH